MNISANSPFMEKVLMRRLINSAKTFHLQSKHAYSQEKKAPKNSQMT